LIANTENSLKDCQKEKDALEIFKKDLGNLWEIISFKKAHREKHNFSKFPQ
jgi:type I restriction enzyme R subunit